MKSHLAKATQQNAFLKQKTTNYLFIIFLNKTCLPININLSALLVCIYLFGGYGPVSSKVLIVAQAYLFPVLPNASGARDNAIHHSLARIAIPL